MCNYYYYNALRHDDMGAEHALSTNIINQHDNLDHDQSSQMSQDLHEYWDAPKFVDLAQLYPQESAMDMDATKLYNMFMLINKNMMALRAEVAGDINSIQLEIEQKAQIDAENTICRANKEYQSILDRLDECECKANFMIGVIGKYEENIDIIQNKIVSMEQRSMKNNVIISGIPESRDESCK